MLKEINHYLFMIVTVMTDKINEILNSIYFNANLFGSFSSQSRLLKEAKKVNPKITKNDVKKWWASKRVPSIFSPRKKIFKRAIFISKRPQDIWLADLGDFTRFKKENSGFKWLLICQDLFSRKIKALVAQKSKTAKETGESFEKIFEEAKELPRKINTDQGGEFKGFCDEVFKKHNVVHYTTSGDIQKSAVVERALLVVKQRLFKIMENENSRKWIDKLEKIMNVFNNTDNRNLGYLTPNEASERKNRSKVFHTSVTSREDKRLNKNPKFLFDVGQIVRVSKKYTALSKSYEGLWSEILYTIHERFFRSGVQVYKLIELLTKEPIRGVFYKEEIKPVENVDINNLPKIEKIYAIREKDNETEVQIEYPPSKIKKWYIYRHLIPFKKQ